MLKPAAFDVNQRMVGKVVKVLNSQEGDWIGEVLSVKDTETFLVKKDSFIIEVSIFDVRSLEA